jgi:NAD(P)-dependent dehydrogenase (short-subunit alcohol dehydrogenase family)
MSEPHSRINALNESRWLKGKVAVVAGASRGCGRGIAIALGEWAATVYVTGRSIRGGPPPVDLIAGTIEETAEGHCLYNEYGKRCSGIVCRRWL